ncbi:MAG: hypothetical protein LBQ54_10335 [Planctomycetaceae bacterium]|jgi:hypothetical protein|nr:hypothetical protein [Planctomycetaceae bacterium]
MGEKIFLSIIAAVVGGVVGAAATMFLPQKSAGELAGNLDELTVKKLKVSDTLYLWPEGKDDPDLVMTNGGVLARTRIIATQLCGNILMGNAVFTTPDNPQTQVDQCRIYTEMGSNPKTGGALVVRSPSGPNVLSQGVAQSGHSYNVGYDEKDGLWGYAMDNVSKDRALMALVPIKPRQQDGQQQPPAEGGVPADPNAVPPQHQENVMNVPSFNQNQPGNPQDPSAAMIAQPPQPGMAR